MRGDNISEFSNNSNYAVRGENVSEFVNNANYAVRGENISEFNNNAGYLTQASLPTKVNEFVVNWTSRHAASGGTASQSFNFPVTYSSTPAITASVSGTSKCGLEVTAVDGTRGYVTALNNTSSSASILSVSVFTAGN